MTVATQDATEDKVIMTRWEIEKEREHAVISEKLKQMESLIPKVFASLEVLEKAVTQIPIDIIDCRDRMDSKLKSYMHDEFITATELNKFEAKLESDISAKMADMKVDIAGIKQMVWKATWILSGFISSAMVIFWILSNTNIKIMG